jgi:hypothetical protein
MSGLHPVAQVGESMTIWRELCSSNWDCDIWYTGTSGWNPLEAGRATLHTFRASLGAGGPSSFI